MKVTRLSHRARRAQRRTALKARAELGQPIRKKNGKSSLIAAVEEARMLAAAGLSTSPRARARRERKRPRRGFLSVTLDDGTKHWLAKDTSTGPGLTYEGLLRAKRALQQAPAYQVPIQGCGSPVKPEAIVKFIAAPA